MPIQMHVLKYIQLVACVKLSKRLELDIMNPVDLLFSSLADTLGDYPNDSLKMSFYLLPIVLVEHYQL